MSILNERQSSEKLKRHLWFYVSKYTAQNGASLELLYNKVVKNRGESSESSISSGSQKGKINTKV